MTDLVRTTQPDPWTGSHALGEKFHQLGLPVALVDLWGDLGPGPGMR